LVPHGGKGKRETPDVKRELKRERGGWKNCAPSSRKGKKGKKKRKMSSLNRTPVGPPIPQTGGKEHSSLFCQRKKKGKKTHPNAFLR